MSEPLPNDRLSLLDEAKATEHFGSPRRRVFSTPSPPSLEMLRACLTSFRQTVDFYSNKICAGTSAALSGLSKR